VSLHSTFAANLRRLCDNRESISAVSRATGINRQQFGRYLSGHSLPNSRNIKKLAQYFRIAETELFFDSSRSAISNKLSKEFIRNGEVFTHDEINSVVDLLHVGHGSSVVPGLYFAYFANPDDPTLVMRSTLVVKRIRERTIFRRLTCPGEEQNSWWSRHKGDHTGIVLDRRNWVYFIGLNSLGHREPTLLVVQYVVNLDPLLGGHATLLTPEGPTVTAVVISACPPGYTLRSALRASHVYSVDDTAIDPFVLDAIEHQCRALLRKVQPLVACSSEKT
jgi:transcriptional regulator with XRE-family HTH domain